MINERQAIEVVRVFRLGGQQAPWDETSLKVRPDVIEVRRTWIVSALDALQPGEPDWMRGTEQAVDYFVDMKTGRFFGFDVGRVPPSFFRGHRPSSLTPYEGRFGPDECYAIEVVRAFLLCRKKGRWDEASFTVNADVIQGRRVWIVSSLDALPAAHQNWMRGKPEPLSCFVDVETGRFLGFEARGARTMFADDLP